MCVTRWLTSSSVPSSHNECACKKVRTIHSPLATGVRRGLPVERESPCFARFAELRVSRSTQGQGQGGGTSSIVGDTGCCFQGPTSSSQGTGWSGPAVLAKNPSCQWATDDSLLVPKQPLLPNSPSRYKCGLASIEARLRSNPEALKVYRSDRSLSVPGSGNVVRVIFGSTTGVVQSIVVCTTGTS